MSQQKFKLVTCKFLFTPGECVCVFNNIETSNLPLWDLKSFKEQPRSRLTYHISKIAPNKLIINKFDKQVTFKVNFQDHY